MAENWQKNWHRESTDGIASLQTELRVYRRNRESTDGTAQLIISFMWIEVAYAVNQTTRKKTTENRADRVFLISFVRPRGADLKFRKGLIWKKKQNCISWAHIHQSSYSHIAVTSQESKKRGKTISCSHSWLSKLTPMESSCRQHSESYFPWFI